jgi:hypothetical protein
MDAIFRAVTLKHPRGGRGTWAQLPPEHGKPDTVSRTYRRWARANFWTRLLAEVACPTSQPVFRNLAHPVCCAFRRAVRVMGLRAIVLARRMRLHSALPAPSVLLPDPDLSEMVWPIQTRLVESMLAKPDWRPPPCSAPWAACWPSAPAAGASAAGWNRHDVPVARGARRGSRGACATRPDHGAPRDTSRHEACFAPPRPRP